MPELKQSNEQETTSRDVKVVTDIVVYKWETGVA